MRYPKKESLNTIDEKTQEIVAATSIDRAIDELWTSSKKSLLREMKLAEVKNTVTMRNELARRGIIGDRSTKGTKNGNLLGKSVFGSKAQYGTWYRDHVEHFTVGYENRYCCSFYLQNGRLTRTYMLDGNELSIIFGYLTNNCNYIESQHSRF